MFRVTPLPLAFVNPAMLTIRFVIQVSVDINPLSDTATDCLRFVTEFFEVISQSGPHIYHSALSLAPRSSIVRKLYGHQISFPVARVVTGIPTSWDSCVASAGATEKALHAVWSPCGQFIACAFGNTIQVRDANTLERVSVLDPLSHLSEVLSAFIAFSPDGQTLACIFQRKFSNRSVLSPRLRPC